MIAHVFVDAENIPPSVTFKVVEHFGREHTITRVDIVAKEDALPYKYRNLDEKIYRVQNCFYGKNSADTWLCFEMVRAIIDEPDLELIIIISSDKDFLPAIKFATDFEKKVFIVSNGAGHKTLTEQMKILDINPALVELKDFRLKFVDVPLKLEKFLPHFGFDIKKFFFDHEDKIKFIFVKRGEKVFEVPFVAGMTTYVFRRVLCELNILGKGASIKNFIAENYLKLIRNRIYFHSEAEISIPTAAELVEEYFIEHAAETCKIFIKHNNKLSEIPFVNGMPFKIFGHLLQERKIIGKAASPAQTAEKNLLKIVDGQIFLRNEEEQETAYGGTIENVDEYFDFHAAELKKIFIKHNGKMFEIPFVEGISIELFGKLLREKNIIGKSASATSIAKKNFLDVRDGKIYLCDEERLSELYAESTGNLDDYFRQNEDKAIKIFVKYNGDIFEIPFVNGMLLTLFEKLLRDRKIIGRNSSAIKVAAQSLLDVRDERIFLYSEEALENIQNDSLINVDDYLNKNALDIRNLLINHNGKTFSIPFVNGMPIEIFGKILRERKVIDASAFPEEVIANNFLTISDGKIFIGKGDDTE
ncbi:MAG: NYN domain-containing protein [Selenomonadaceae bacterium]|nr:NYN domain-containing protein [Selenomonadaceae bacterium]